MPLVSSLRVLMSRQASEVLEGFNQVTECFEYHSMIFSLHYCLEKILLDRETCPVDLCSRGLKF